MKTITAVVLGMFLLACGSTQKVIEPTAASTRLDDMVAAQEFTIKMEWVEPLMTNSMVQIMSSGLFPPGNALSRIHIQGSGNYITLQGDSAKAVLPYFGERQMGGGYNSSEGISFNGKASDLKIEKIAKRQAYDINFTVRERSETFQVRLTLLPGGTAVARVNSSDRFSIGYEGQWQEVDVAEATLIN